MIVQILLLIPKAHTSTNTIWRNENETFPFHDFKEEFSWVFSHTLSFLRSRFSKGGMQIKILAHFALINGTTSSKRFSWLNDWSRVRICVLFKISFTGPAGVTFFLKTMHSKPLWANKVRVTTPDSRLRIGLDGKHIHKTM